MRPTLDVLSGILDIAGVALIAATPVWIFYFWREIRRGRLTTREIVAYSAVWAAALLSLVPWLLSIENRGLLHVRGVVIAIGAIAMTGVAIQKRRELRSRQR